MYECERAEIDLECLLYDRERAETEFPEYSLYIGFLEYLLYNREQVEIDFLIYNFMA